MVSTRNKYPSGVRRFTMGWLVFGALISNVACPAGNSLRTTNPEGFPMTPFPRVLSFSETDPVTSLTSLGNLIFAGTPSGVIRYNARNHREYVRLTSAEGLAGDYIYALSAHSSSGLWVATNKGISRYHNGVWLNYQGGNPAGDTVTAMVATPWGFWAGGSHGLGRFKDGKWKGFLPGAQVTTLIEDLSGKGIWVGTTGEGLYHFDGKHFKSHNSARGQLIRHIKGISYTKDGGLVVVGRTKQTHLICFFDGTHWVAYSLEPQGKLHWVHQVSQETLLAYDNHVLVLERFLDIVPQGRKRKVPVGPVVLKAKVSPLAPSGYPTPILYTRVFDKWLPPDPTVVVGFESGVLIGTRTMGVVRFDGQRVIWYRTKNLLQDNQKLNIACDDKDCYLAGRAGKGFRFRDGNAFKPIQVGTDASVLVQAFVKNPSGSVDSIHTPADGRSIVISRLVGQTFNQIVQAKITIPKGKVFVRFARYDPQGKLWVGLSYREAEGDQVPWGIGVVSSDGSVLYHRSTLLPTEKRKQGSLALPDDIRDVRFWDGYVWLATGAGVCRVQGNHVKLFTENEGLASEIVYSFARSDKGEILVASYGGVGRYDGKRWYFDFEGPLRTTTRALLRDHETLWVGTSKGLVQWRGKRQSQIMTSKHGLAGDVVQDLRIDPRGRLWILTDGGLSIHQTKD